MEPLGVINLCEQYFFDADELLLCNWILNKTNATNLYIKLRETYYKGPIEEDWLRNYHDIMFFRFFRIQKSTFLNLLNVVLENDNHKLMRKKYHGGNLPIPPEKALLTFLTYMATQESLLSIGQRFGIVPSTAMNIVNALLYIMLKINKKYIFWPRTDEEVEHIINGFTHYPNVLGAIDGSQIDIKVVPHTQHDSYVNRYLRHSINAMVISTAEKILTYVFIGFPGSAHDSRVFSNSTFVQNIATHGSQFYFPNEECHILGDSAFPLKMWMMTPYKRRPALNRIERQHNYHLSADRVVVEHIFARIKGRFRRVIFINTYSISKAIEITTAACVLHNFCYMNKDQWEDELYEDVNEQEFIAEDNDEETRRAQLKRNRIARELLNNV
ncbi:putative nuclease HARBI1 [Zophobas morio]